MPRFKFSWSNLDADLLKALVSGIGLNGSPAEALRKRFGARPKEDFVAASWPVLIQYWLATDQRSAAEIAGSLRDKGFGKTSETDPLEYLRSCRNTIGLRRIVLPIFIAIGELTPEGRSLSGPAAESFGSGALGGKDRIGGDSASRDGSENREDRSKARDETSQPGGEGLVGGDRVGGPDSARGAIAGSEASDARKVENPVEHLRAWLVASMSEMFEADVEPDDDGDIPVPFGSARIFVSARPEPLHVEIFSLLVADLPRSQELLEGLNGLNASLPFAKIYHHAEAGAVILATHISAQGLSSQLLGMNLSLMAGLADHLDTSIQQKFGGNMIGQDVKADEQDI